MDKNIDNYDLDYIETLERKLKIREKTIDNLKEELKQFQELYDKEKRENISLKQINEMYRRG